MNRISLWEYAKGSMVPLLLSLGLAMPLLAERVTVGQLEQTLATAAKMQDEQVAQKLNVMELTERLSGTRFAQLEPNLPGPASRRALALLADTSIFLDLPSEDLPAKPTPDRASQESLIRQAREYVIRTILKLPNFFATRETISYTSEAMDAKLISSKNMMFHPFHEIDKFSVVVLYRDNHELVARGDSGSAKELKTVGEFGPILVTVFNDLTKGKVVWSHWGQGAGDVLAVFRFSVPQSASHYSVVFPGVKVETHHCPAYHGEIALDASNGAIMRLTLEGEPDPNDALGSANLSVEYGPTEIGQQTYILPIRSIAFGMIRNVNEFITDTGGVVRSLGEPKKYLNQVLFTRYHVFRSDVRIIPEKTVP